MSYDSLEMHNNTQKIDVHPRNPNPLEMCSHYAHAYNMDVQGPQLMDSQLEGPSLNLNRFG